MLCLSRKPNESIVINGDIVVTIIDVRAGKVRLGIAAPQNVPIHRQEVAAAIERSGGNARESHANRRPAA